MIVKWTESPSYDVIHIIRNKYPNVDLNSMIKTFEGTVVDAEADNTRGIVHLTIDCTDGCTRKKRLSEVEVLK